MTGIRPGNVGEWVQWLMLRGLALTMMLGGLEEYGYCQFLIETKHLYAKSTRMEISEVDESAFAAIATSFVKESEGRAVKYLTTTSFPVMLSPANLPLRQVQSADRFFERLNMLRTAKGCQLEVFSIETDSAMRWVCAGGQYGTRVLQGNDPFSQPAGYVFYIRLHVGLGFTPATFEMYVLSDKPAIASARDALAPLIRIEPEVAWRIVLAEHPWLFQDILYPPFNPNVLRYKVPVRLPQSGYARIRVRFDVRNRKLVEWMSEE